MPHVKRKACTEQAFDHLTNGLDGSPRDQIAARPALYAGHVEQVDALNEELGSLREYGRASGRNRELAGPARRTGIRVQRHEGRPLPHVSAEAL
jgi:hypothetical protein